MAQIQFRIDDALEADLSSRCLDQGEYSLTARKQLVRYFSLLRHGLAEAALTKAEASLLCDAFNGTLFLGFDIEPRQYLLIGVGDSMGIDKLHEKWGVDRAKLIAKLQQVSPLGAAAILDAIERFWNIPSHQLESIEEQLVAVGLWRPLFKVMPTDDYDLPSEVPDGQYAGTVCIDDALNPGPVYLYSEAGRKFFDHQQFYHSLWHRGFRYFRYAGRGKMHTIVPVEVSK